MKAASMMRVSRVLVAAAAAAVLAAACDREPAARPAGPATVPAASVPATTGGSIGASRPAPPSSSGGRSRSAPATLTVTADRAVPACGISLRSRFIPPSSTDGGQLQAFLVGAVLGMTGGGGGDRPAPGAVAPARQGTVATVLGRRFGVLAVSTAGQWVRVQPLC